MPDENISIAMALKIAIQESGRSVYELARIAKVPRESLYRFLRGQRMLDLATCDKVLKALKATCKLERVVPT